MILTNSKRVRIDYSPITTTVNLVCDTPLSPTTQVYNAENNEYEPNRSVTPCIVRPVVNAVANDGTVPDTVRNKVLTNIVWKVNGVNITSASGWSGLYEIVSTATDDKGTIKIKRNVSPNEKFDLTFEATLVDTRTSTNISIKSDAITLSTTDKASDIWKVDTGVDDNFSYDPFLDDLLLYEYKVLKGYITDTAADRAAATNEKSYLLKIPLSAYRGAILLKSGYTVKLEKRSGASWVAVTSTDKEVVSTSITEIKINMRYVPVSYSYKISIMQGSVVKATKEFSLYRKNSEPNVRVKYNPDIKKGDTVTYNEVSVSYNGKEVEYPERLMNFQWQTTNSGGEIVDHGTGLTASIDLTSAKIGTDSSSFLDIAVRYEVKPEL